MEAITIYLLKNGANISATDQDGQSPLFEATQKSMLLQGFCNIIVVVYIVNLFGNFFT